VGKGRIRQPETFPDSGCGPLYRVFLITCFSLCLKRVLVSGGTLITIVPDCGLKVNTLCTLLNISCLNKCQRVTAFVVDFSVLGEIPPALNWIDMVWEFFDYTCM
jgi:hypothetical protein